MVSTPVDLQGDAAFFRMPNFGFLPFHDFHAIDPSGDMGRIPFDAGAQFIPLPGAPEPRPAGRFDRQSGGRFAGLLVGDLGDLVGETVVPQVGFAAESFTVDAHQVAAGVIVDHGLPRLAVLRAAQEQSAVRAEIIVHLDGHLEVAELLIGQHQSPVAGNILTSNNSAVFHHPPAAAGIFAGGGVAAFRADMPALE